MGLAGSDGQPGSPGQEGQPGEPGQMGEKGDQGSNIILCILILKLTKTDLEKKYIKIKDILEKKVLKENRATQVHVEKLVKRVKQALVSQAQEVQMVYKEWLDSEEKKEKGVLKVRQAHQFVLKMSTEIWLQSQAKKVKED